MDHFYIIWNVTGTV